MTTTLTLYFSCCGEQTLTFSSLQNPHSLSLTMLQGMSQKQNYSNVQDMWYFHQEHSPVWSFGIWILCSQECGFYDVSDFLLGDHLYEKLKWIDAALPPSESRGYWATRNWSKWSWLDPCIRRQIDQNLTSRPADWMTVYTVCYSITWNDDCLESTATVTGPTLATAFWRCLSLPFLM